MFHFLFSQKLILFTRAFGKINSLSVNLPYKLNIFCEFFVNDDYFLIQIHFYMYYKNHVLIYHNTKGFKKKTNKNKKNRFNVRKENF